MLKMNIEKALDGGMSSDSMVRIVIKPIKFELLRDVSPPIVTTRHGKQENKKILVKMFNMGNFCFVL